MHKTCVSTGIFLHYLCFQEAKKKGDILQLSIVSLNPDALRERANEEIYTWQHGCGLVIL